MAPHPQLLERNPVFGALPPAERAGLLAAAVCRRFERGEMLACAGDVWPCLFIVARGGIDALQESPEGRSLVVTTFQPGDIFWGLAFFHEGMPLPVSLRASGPTEILLWPRECLEPLLQQRGKMAWELARMMVLKMVRASEVLSAMTFQPVAGRLARLLLENAGADAAPTNRSLTLDEMAARIGSTREMVCRFLHRFAGEGIIDITRTEYCVTDPQRLAEMAQQQRG